MNFHEPQGLPTRLIGRPSTKIAKRSTAIIADRVADANDWR